MTSFSYIMLWLGAVSVCINASYYISPNRFDFNNADLFCRVQCHSNMASVHSNDDYQFALSVIEESKTLFITNKNVWLGLNDIEKESIYKYKDGTLFNFGNNTSTHSIIWKVGSPNNANPINGIGGQDCIQFSYSFNYLLDDTECNNLDRILCNDCDSMINKYVIVNELLYFDEAETFCQNEIGTHLASIHSLYDHRETLFLCERYINDCWIGLNINVNKWTDGTKFDYGNEYNEYPWRSNQPNVTNINENQFTMGTALVSDKWTVFNQNQKHYFLCNLPSTICNSSQWQVINGQYVAWNECEIDINTDFMAILSDKEWINTNNKLIIEYMYKINEKAFLQQDIYFNSAILLFNFESVCNYYEIGILYVNNIFYLYIAKWMNGYYYLLHTNEIIEYDEFVDNSYHTLKIVVIEARKFNINLNGIHYLEVIDSDRSNSTADYSGYSGRIGLVNNNLKITIKSLFVSGSQVLLKNTQNIAECANIIELQLNYDEYELKYGIIITIIITNGINTLQLQLNQTQMILISNISNNIINQRINRLQSLQQIDKNCIFDDKMDINTSDNILIINTTIFVCEPETQSILTVDFTVNLQRDLIETNELLIALNINASNLDVQVLNFNEMEVIVPSTTTSNNLSNTDSTMNWNIISYIKQIHILWVVIYVCAVCAFCVILLVVCVKCYKWRRDIKRDEIGGGGHSIPIMALKTEAISNQEKANLIHRNVDDSPNMNEKHRHKESESLIVRYPGDDHEFKKRYDNKYNKKNVNKFRTPGSADNNNDFNDELNPNLQNDEFIIHEMNIQLGPGFAYNCPENDSVVHSDSQRNTTKH